MADGKSRWSGNRGSAKRDSELIWEARRRFQQSKRKSSGAAIAAVDSSWQGAVEESSTAVCILEGQLSKQPRGRSSRILLRGSARTRYFKLFASRLSYFAQERDGMVEKGFIIPGNICVVEEVNSDVFGKNSFQVVSSHSDIKPLYLTAPSERERDAWMMELRLLCYMKGNVMYSHYHPDVLHGADWHCCKNSAQIHGCQLAYDYPSFEHYREDVVEAVVDPLKMGPPSTPASPLPSVTSLEVPSATREGRAVSLSEEPTATADNGLGEEEGFKRRGTFAGDNSNRSNTNNPFIKSMIRRQTEAPAPKPPKPQRKKTPFDTSISVPDVACALDATSPTTPTSPSLSDGGTEDLAPEPVPAAAQPASVTDTDTGDLIDINGDASPQPDGSSSSWKPVWPEDKPVNIAIDTEHVDGAGDEHVDGAGDEHVDGAGDDQVDGAGDVQGNDEPLDAATEPPTASLDENKKPEIELGLAQNEDEGEIDNDLDIVSPLSQEDHNPFGDANFGTMKVPEVENLIIKSTSSASLASTSLVTESLKLPGPPRSPKHSRSSSTNDLTTIGASSTSPLTIPVETARGQALGASSSNSTDSLSTASSQSTTTSTPMSSSRPASTVPKQQSIDLICLDDDDDDADQDESTNASLLTTSSGLHKGLPPDERNRATTVSKMIPKALRPNAKEIGKNRNSLISMSNLDTAETFDIISANDCDPKASSTSTVSQNDRRQSFVDDVNPFKALHQACQQGLVEEVIEQLEAGVNPDEPQQESRRPPIFIAYYHDYTEVLEVLLSHGAQVNMTMGGASLVHVAAQSNNTRVLALMIKHLAMVDMQDWQMRTPLHLACEAGHIEAAKLLIDSGSNLKPADQDGYTPLHMCTGRGHKAAAELLLESGAPAFPKNKADLTPLDLAVKEGHRDVTALLRSLLPDTEQTYICRHSFRAHRKEINTLSFLPDQSVLTGASENQVCIWGSENVEKPVFRRKFTNTILSSAVHQTDSRALVAIGSDQVHVLDLKHAGWRVVLLDEVQGAMEEEQLYLVAFSPTGILATGGVVSGTQVLLWDLSEEQVGLVRKPHRTINVNHNGAAVIHNIQFAPREDRPIIAVSVQPGNDRLHCKGNNFVHLFDWMSGCHLRQIDTGVEETPNDLSMVFSAQGRYLLTGSCDGKVSVWTASSGLLVNQVELEEDIPVRNVAFSSNGHTLVIASDSGRVHLYNLATGRPFYLPEQNEQRPAISLAVSRNGEVLAAGYDDGSVKVWNVVGSDSPAGLSEVEAFSPFEYTRVIQPNGEMSAVTLEFLHAEYKKLDTDGSGSLCEDELGNYFLSYLNTILTAEMFVDLQQNFLMDADLGGLTVEGFTSMAFQHFCLDPDTMWDIWLKEGYPPKTL